MKKENFYQEMAKMSERNVLKYFNTNLEGLNEEQVEQIREEYGANVVDYGKKENVLVKLFKAFINPFTSILLVLAIISYFTDYVIVDDSEQDLTAVIIILTMVLISGLLTYIQSAKTDKAAAKIKSMVKITCAVKRDNQKPQEINMEDLVIGDIIYLSAGDMLPADVRLLKTKDLFISQASLTGESDAVEKNAFEIEETKEGIFDYENLAFMGSNVISGSAIGLVVATGKNTEFGKIVQTISVKPVKNSFDKGVSSVSWVLIKFMVIMVPIVLFVNGFTKGDWLEASLFALSVAVGLTPEMLPLIVTTNLVKGTTDMAKEGTIMKNLNAVQNFGAMDILCTDKTGTLTQDKIILEYHMDVQGHEDDRVLRHAFLNSYFQTGLKNLMDIAIINAADEELSVKVSNYEKVDEIPFEFTRRRMSVVIKDKNNKTQMITKGAVEEILSICNYVDMGDKVVELTDAIKEKVMQVVDSYNEDGFRVLAVAQKSNPSKVGEFGVEDESDMVLIGYLAFLDPPKESSKQALLTLKEHGVDVKVLTGDNALVTRSVSNQVGLDSSKIITGQEIDLLDDEQLYEKSLEYNIFCKLSPQQKKRIVKVLRDSNHVVGFMGDGINDAMAMKEADVGISVDTAVDIAKESADVILLEKDLMILEKGILAGRRIFGNIIKYIKITASSNFGNMFSVLVASLFLPFLPMLPIQILLLNLIYDISCLSIPWDNVDKEYLDKPRKWNDKSISSFMKWLGPTSSVFDITTFLLMYFVIAPAILGGPFHELTPDKQIIFMAIFHTGWFVESLWTQTLVLHILRTPKIPFIQSKASFILTVITLLGIAIGTVIPFTGIAQALDMMPLPSIYFVWLLITIVCYLILTTIVKNIYIKIEGELL